MLCGNRRFQQYVACVLLQFIGTVALLSCEHILLYLHHTELEEKGDFSTDAIFLNCLSIVVENVLNVMCNSLEWFSIECLSNEACSYFGFSTV